MSYILDALKKSEQERQSNSAMPSQPPIPTKGFAPQLSTSHIFSIVAVLALLILGIYYFISSKPFVSNVTIEPIVVEEPQRVRPASANLVAPVEVKDDSFSNEAASGNGRADEEIASLYSSVDSAPAVVNKPRPIKRSAPVQAVSKPRPANVVPPEPGFENEEPEVEVASEPVAPKVVNIPLINNISWAVKGEIPSIDYSAHIYAQDNSKGFVILNGAKKHAGDKLRNGVFVEKIEEDNVVLSYNGVLFKLPAMKSWKNK